MIEDKDAVMWML